MALPHDPMLFDLGKHMADRINIIVRDTLDTCAIAKVERTAAFQLVVASLLMLAIRFIRADGVGKNEYLSLCAKLWSEADKR